MRGISIVAVLLKRWLHWVGGAVAVLGIFFVARRLSIHAGEIEIAQLESGTWFALLGLAVVYTAANGFLALAWKHILEFLGVSLDIISAVRIYGISQLAKYVPGNIFHFLGRQALGVAAGIPGLPLAKSAAWELGAICVAAALFAPLVVPVAVPMVPDVFGVVLFGAGLGLVYLITRRYVSRDIGHALLDHASFHFVAALVFIGVLIMLQPDGGVPVSLLPLLVSGYVIAWLAGFVTPGAPAGVGVREATLLFLLDRTVPEGILLVAILLSRAVTVVGDTFFFCVAWSFENTELDNKKRE